MMSHRVAEDWTEGWRSDEKWRNKRRKEDKRM